jgi:hypothetical protein
MMDLPMERKRAKTATQATLSRHSTEPQAMHTGIEDTAEDETVESPFIPSKMRKQPAKFAKAIAKRLTKGKPTEMDDEPLDQEPQRKSARIGRK